MEIAGIIRKHAGWKTVTKKKQWILSYNTPCEKRKASKN
jgi:hypothetical protein